MLKSRGARSIGKYIPMDGNTAASYIGYAFSDTSIIFPITSSSPMGENVDTWSANGTKNMFGDVPDVTIMESEMGAAGGVHGSLSAGALTTTYTSSQGLLLMIPNMFKMASSLLPGVIHLSTRTLIQHIGSIFCDHSDAMAVRTTGWTMINSTSVQEAHDLAIVTHLTAIESSIPAIHFFDGIRVSHEYSKINTVSYDDLKPLVNMDKIREFRSKSFNFEHPTIRGTPVNIDPYMAWHFAPEVYFRRIPDIVQKMMDKVGDLTGRHYKLYDYIGPEEPESVVVMMGSNSQTMKAAIEYFNKKQGTKVGLVIIRLFRPFSTKHFLEAIPKSVKKVCVLDRVHEFNTETQPLHMEITSAFYQHRRFFDEVIGGIYGISGTDLTPKTALAVLRNLVSEKPKDHFTVGINDDVLHTNITTYDEDEDADLVPEGTKECIFWGMGGDGTVGANKEAIKIISKYTDQFAQGYFLYDAKKTGGKTFSNLRFGPSPIPNEYEVQRAHYLACHTPSYLTKYPFMADRLREDGAFVINCDAKTIEDLEAMMPNEMKKKIAERNGRIYVVDANRVSTEVGLPGRINMIMQSVFFKLSEVIPVDQALKLLKDSVKSLYAKRGQKVIDKNIAAIDKGLEAVIELKYDREKWRNLVVDPENDLGAPQRMKKYKQTDDPRLLEVAFKEMDMKGSEIPVSKFPPNGQMPTNTAKYEKRRVALKVPKWHPESCIQCNACSLVCPHAVIRPFIVDKDREVPEGFETIPAEYPAFEGKRFRIQISAQDCIGCEVCARQCPTNALEMVEATDEVFEREQELFEFAHNEIGYQDKNLSKKDRFSVTGSQYFQPLLEFSGACGGCGQTPLVKLLTQLFGERMIIANATGCSIIWGGYFPSYPYTVNSDGHGPSWGNSLFEDNAEYGYGMAFAYMHRRNALARNLGEALEIFKPSNDVRENVNGWIENKDDADLSVKYGKEVRKWIQSLESESHSELVAELKNSVDLLTKPSFWIIGGDGWAYDIGFGGLDHVLAQKLDVNVLVMDNECYANTGFQASKATPIGAKVKFAMGGKESRSKDLGQIAMTYGTIYVGSIALGADYNHTLKVFQEAESFKGPSIVIAYSPCIGHGIKTGMGTTRIEEKQLVKNGFWSLYKYDPRRREEGKNPFVLVSKKPKVDEKFYSKFIMNEDRFASLHSTNPEKAKRLNKELEKQIMERYEILKKKASDN